MSIHQIYRFLIEIRGDRYLMLLVVGLLRGDRCLMLLVCWGAIALIKKWYDKLYEFGFLNENS